MFVWTRNVEKKARKIFLVEIPSDIQLFDSKSFLGYNTPPLLVPFYSEPKPLTIPSPLLL